MAAVITPEIRERLHRQIKHQVMTMLHAGMAHRGYTYEQLAERLGWTVKRTQRLFWDERAWHDKGLQWMAELAWALDARLQFTLHPLPDEFLTPDAAGDGSPAAKGAASEAPAAEPKP